MDLGLRDRVALVTGGSKGMGRGIAEALIAEGARVAIASRSADRIRATAEEIDATGYEFDSADLDAVGPLVDRVEADLGPIDVYIANTGGPPANADPLAFTREQWEDAHRTLILSPMAFLERLLPGMRERGWGRVVAIEGLAAYEPIDSLQLSNAYRAGVVGAFKVLARRVAADGVTLNTIHPGSIATDRVIDTSGSREAAEADARKRIPAARLGTVEDIAAAVAFLCSDRAGYITGTTLTVDGGVSRSV